MSTPINEWKDVPYNLPKGVELTEVDKKKIGEATFEIQYFVAAFNAAYRLWERSTKCGANFRFKYDAHSGKKYMYVEDVSPEWPDIPKKEDPRIRSAGETIEKAHQELNPKKGE